METLSVYILIVSVMERDWHNDMNDENSYHYKTSAKYIKNQIDLLYKEEPTYYNVTVTRMVFGSIRTTLRVELRPSNKQVIDKLTVSIKRGRIANMKVDPSTFVFHEIGHCGVGCSIHANCLKNSTGDSNCKCKEGFDGDGQLCFDINDCTILNGGCSQKCVNVNGSYYCSCNIGFNLGKDHKSCQANKNYVPDQSFCKSEFNQGISWKATISGRTEKSHCPNHSNQGQATRVCRNRGIWKEPDLSKCITSSLRKNSDEVSKLNLTSAKWITLKQILRSMVEETLAVMNILYAGDILETKRIITTLLIFIKDKINEQPLGEIGKMFNLLNALFNNMFDKSNHAAWHGIPQPMYIIDDYLLLIHNTAKMISNHMINKMYNISVKHPELVFTFNLSAVGDTIGMHIQTVEMRSFATSGYKVAKVSGYKVTYPPDLFEKEVQKLIDQGGLYSSIGCWADYKRYATHISLETRHPLLLDHFYLRQGKIRKCGLAADSFHFNVFAVQEGLCAASRDFHRNYDQFGAANNCEYGKGGSFAYNAYVIRKYYTGIVTVKFSSLGDLFLSLSPRTLPPSSNTIQTTGEIILTKVLRNGLDKRLVTAVQVSFFKKLPNATGVVCAQINQQNRTFVWSLENCITEIMGNHVKCNCSSLSYQTLLYNYSTHQNSPKKGVLYYKELSYASYGIACATFIFTLVLYYCRRMERMSIIFQLNLTILMICVETMFIFAIGNDWKIEKTLCKWLTVIFHFMLTSLFSWFLAQTWYASHTMSDIINIRYKRRITFYHLLGYGCPCLVSLLSLATFYDSYGTTVEKCWIKDTLLVALFIPPIGLFILINIVVLGIVLGMYFSHKTYLNFPDEKSEEIETRVLKSVRDSVIISGTFLPFFTATWVFAVLSLLYDDTLFKYLFLGFNAGQGIFYLIGHCCLCRYNMKKSLMELDENEHNQIIDLHDIDQVTSVNLFKTRAAKHCFTNKGFGEAPNLLKATAYNGSNFTGNARRSIPTEVMYEMQQQWYNKKPDE